MFHGFNPDCHAPIESYRAVEQTGRTFRTTVYFFLKTSSRSGSTAPNHAAWVE